MLLTLRHRVHKEEVVPKTWRKSCREQVSLKKKKKKTISVRTKPIKRNPPGRHLSNPHIPASSPLSFQLPARTLLWPNPARSQGTQDPMDGAQWIPHRSASQGRGQSDSEEEVWRGRGMVSDMAVLIEELDLEMRP